MRKKNRVKFATCTQTTPNIINARLGPRANSDAICSFAMASRKKMRVRSSENLTPERCWNDPLTYLFFSACLALSFFAFALLRRRMAAWAACTQLVKSGQEAGQELSESCKHSKLALNLNHKWLLNKWLLNSRFKVQNGNYHTIVQVQSMHVYSLQRLTTTWTIYIMIGGYIKTLLWPM